MLTKQTKLYPMDSDLSGGQRYPEPLHNPLHFFTLVSYKSKTGAQVSAGILARRGSGTSKVERWRTKHGRKIVCFLISTLTYFVEVTRVAEMASGVKLSPSLDACPVQEKVLY